MAVSIVQEVTPNSGTSATATTTSITLTAGNAMLVGLRLGASRTVSSVTDSQRNAWNRLIRILGATFINVVEIWECHDAASTAANVVTFNLSSSTTWGTGGIEASGISTTAPTDASSSLEKLSGVSPCFASADSTVIDTSADGTAILCMMSCNNSRDYSASTGFTRIGTGAVTNVWTYRTASSALTDERGGCSWPSGNSAVVAAIASIKADSAGGSTQPPRSMHQFRMRG